MRSSWLLLLPPISSTPDYLTVVSILILCFTIYLYNLIIAHVLFLPLESKWHKLRNSYLMSCSSRCLGNICWTKEGKENRVFKEKKVSSKQSPGATWSAESFKGLSGAEGEGGKATWVREVVTGPTRKTS